MFELDLIENKPYLLTLLSANTNMLFMDGMICSLHKHGMCMVQMTSSEIEVDGNPVNDMNELNNILNSRTVVSGSFNPEEGVIVIKRPYKWIPTIPRLRDDKYLVDVKKQLRNIRTLKKARKTWVDRWNKKHRIARFKVENIVLVDAILRLGITESLRIRTGKSMVLTNMKTDAKVVLRIRSEKSTIFLSKDGRQLLLDSLMGDESRITIANGVVMLVENDITMILAGRIPEDR